MRFSFNPIQREVITILMLIAVLFLEYQFNIFS